MDSSQWKCFLLGLLYPCLRPDLGPDFPMRSLNLSHVGGGMCGVHVCDFFCRPFALFSSPSPTAQEYKWTLVTNSHPSTTSANSMAPEANLRIILPDLGPM